jgi:NADPH:quinone reductase-like Zn-dependent oxidoreductase
VAPIHYPSTQLSFDVQELEMTIGTTTDRDQALVADAVRAEAAMKAVVQRRYGPPEVLEYTEVGRPVVGDGDVLVGVRAASVHPGDYFVMTGVPSIVRLAFGLRRPRHPIPGRDLAGVVAAVGKDVTDLRPGDAVFGWSTTGTLAEYASVPAHQLVRTPANLSAGQAAAVPTSALTALQAMRDVAHVRPGHTVLVTGASGGVGTFAVQIARLLGAEVTGVCSTRNMELVRSLGAAHVIDYTRTDFTRTGLRYDVILDNVEAQTLADARRALTPTGTLIPNSGRGGRRIGPLGRFVKARVRSLVTRQTLRPFTSMEKQEDLRTLAAWLEAGDLIPVIDRTYPLSAAADALRYVGAGHTQGKVVITV